MFVSLLPGLGRLGSSRSHLNIKTACMHTVIFQNSEPYGQNCSKSSNEYSRF